MTMRKTLGYSPDNDGGHYAYALRDEWSRQFDGAYPEPVIYATTLATAFETVISLIDEGETHIEIGTPGHLPITILVPSEFASPRGEEESLAREYETNLHSTPPK